MKQLRLLLLGFILLICNPVQSENLTIKPFFKGSFAELRNEYRNKPLIVVFWSESCAYCMKELAMFGRLQKQMQDVELITVATDSFLDDEIVTQVLERSQLNLKQTWVFADQFPERIYADVNKRWRGELPVTHFFSRDHQEVRHMGIVKEDELLEWLAQQSHDGTELSVQ